MKLTVTFSLLVMFGLSSITANAQLDIKVETAEVQCSGLREVINVTFDKSLSGLLLDAVDKESKAGSDSKEHYKEKRKALEVNVEGLMRTKADDGRMDTLFLVSFGGKVRNDGKGKAPGTVIRLKPAKPIQVPDKEGNYYIDDTLEYILPDDFELEDSDYMFTLADAAKNPSTVKLKVSSNCTQTKEADTFLPSPTYSNSEKEKAKAFDETVIAVTAKDEAVIFADLAFESRKRNNELDTNTHSFTGNVSFVPVRIKRIGFAGNYEFQPFFYELKVNDKGKESSYISRMGGRIKYIRVFADDGAGYDNDRSNRFLPGLAVDLTGGIETANIFDGLNTIGEIKPILPINVFQSRARLLRLDPYVGFTLGYNVFESTRSEDEVPRGALSRQSWIARPMAGFDLTYSEFRDRVIKPTLTLGYTIRWPLFAEDIHGKSPDAENKDVFAGQSRLPRDYFNARLSLDMGTIVTPFIGYETGRLPPDYKLINGQIKVGFAVKFKAK